MDNNLKTYNSKAVVDYYNALKGLMPAEAAVFEMYKDLIAGAGLLDIGVGGGRTTAYLAGRCKSYTAIDYAEGLVNALKKKHPQTAIQAMDARDLSAYGDNSFDFVNFSFNGLDYVDPEGRKQILFEINRVLKPGGIFFFSTHNRAHSSFDEWPWRNKKITAQVRIKTFVKIVPYLHRKIKNQALEQFTDNFAIINDPAHNYSLMTFYTTPAFLREQLARAGFSEAALYNKNGMAVPDEKLDDWIYATAKKAL